VRELENAIRSALALCSNDIVTLDCLPSEIVDSGISGRGANFADMERALVADRPTMDELQRRYLQLVLDEQEGNRRRAAVALGLDRRTVQRLIARYQLRAQEDGAEPDAGRTEDAQDHLPESDC
jgi:DNA-binding NtrC family response regulator